MMKTRSKSKRSDDEQDEDIPKPKKNNQTLVSISSNVVNFNETLQELGHLKAKLEALEENKENLKKLTRTLEQSEKTLKEKLEEITQERDSLRNEKERENRDKQNIENMVTKLDDILTLNVGGKLITTTRSTLTSEKESMLSAMFSERYKLSKDKDGNVFIDRNPDLFKIILEFLRTKQFFGLEHVDIKQLNAELAFFTFPYRITSCNHSIHVIRDNDPHVYINIDPELEGIYEIFKYSENHKIFRYKLYLDNTTIKTHEDHPYITSGEATVALNQTKWFVEIHPKGESVIPKEDRGFAVFLHYKSGPKCLIGYSLTIVNQNNMEKFFSQKVSQTVFETGENFGFRRLAPLDKIYEKDSGYIQNHCLFIDVEINYLRTFSD